MKRVVKVSSVGTRGVQLNVRFTGKKSLGFPVIKTAFGSYSPGEGDDFLIVGSPPFTTVEQAEEWLERLTAEVKEIAELDTENLYAFKRLEMETEV